MPFEPAEFTPQQLGEIDRLCSELLGLDRGEWRAHLKEHCGDPAIFDEVFRLASIAADEDSAESVILPDMQAMFAHAASELEAHALIGKQVGRYQIEGVIATGGMGMVYSAIQENPRRVVALKLIRKGLTSRNALRRFEYEARTLGKLRHECIAQIYEAGIHTEHSSALPYIAMEYVEDAQSIVEYSEANDLTIRERVRLFIAICDGVHHGHLKGIIHRDLKPQNLLIGKTKHPKIIDFGVARSIEEDPFATRTRTMHGQLVGTLQYMSPEQFSLEPGELDIRTDVYSLGVVLYRLVCGTRPYNLATENMIEAAATIQGGLIKRPRTHVPGLAEDLEAIILKALEKDREHRYSTAADLADDLLRFLNSEPIEARAPTTLHQLRLYARRNKAMCAAFAAIVLGVLLGLGGLTFGLVRANAERARAEDLAETERALRSQADAARQRAELQTSRLKQQAYLANLSVADAAIESNAVCQARLRLESCPQELRGWEWSWLQSRLDRSLCTLEGHERSVRIAKYSPDGSEILTASWDGTARLWNAATGEAQRVLQGHEGYVIAASFDRSAKKVLTASLDGTAREWDISTGREVVESRIDVGDVRGACWGGFGDFLVTLTGDGQARKYSRAQPDMPVMLSREACSVVACDAGSCILVGTVSGAVHVLDGDSNEPLVRLEGPQSPVELMAMNQSGRYVAASFANGELYAWDVYRPDSLGRVEYEASAVDAMCFAPSSSELAVAAPDFKIRVIDLDALSEVRVLSGHEGSVRSIAYSERGDRLVTASADRTARVWDAATADTLAVLRGHEDDVWEARFDPSDQHVLTASLDRTARVWHPRTRGEIVSIGKPRNAKKAESAAGQGPGPDTTIALSVDSMRAMISHGDSRVEIWNTEPVSLARALDTGYGKTLAVGVSLASGTFVTVSEQGIVGLWAATAGEPDQELVCDGRPISAAACDREGQSVIFADSGGVVQVRSLEAPFELVRLGHWEQAIRCVSVNSRANLAGVVEADGAISIVNMANSDRVSRFHTSLGPLKELAISSDGVHCIVLGEAGTAQIWNLTTRSLHHELQGHEDRILSVDLNVDGSRAITASRDDTVRIWNVETGAESAVLRGHEGIVYVARFAPDDSGVMTASSDGTTRVWFASPFRDRLLSEIRTSEVGARAARSLVDLQKRATSRTQLAELVRSLDGIDPDVRRTALDLLLLSSSAGKRTRQ